VGGYAQLGKAWPFHWNERARACELAMRLARVDWDDTFPDRTQDEYSVVGNLFIAGHDNKLSAELSRVSLDEAPGGDRDETRIRLQWDVSF
jgi:phosphate-selective porin OprO and OprP